MPELKNYHLFISHAWKYGDEYNHLVSLLENVPNFYWENYSAPKEKPLKDLDGSMDLTTKMQIANAIERKIERVNAVIVISGMYANNREWMEYEIIFASKHNKPIIALMPRGNERMPKYIQDRADTIVNWNTDSIVKAIREYSK